MVAMKSKEAMENSKKDAVEYVSRLLEKLGRLDSDGLRNLNTYMRENVEIDIMQLRSSIFKVITELEKSKYSVIHTKNCADELASISNKIIEMNPREMLFGNAENSEQVMNFFMTYRNIYRAAEFMEKLEMFNKYFNKIESALKNQNVDDSRGPELNFSLIHKMLNISHEIRNRVLIQAKTNSQDVNLTKKTLDQFFLRLDTLTAEFESRYCSMCRRILELMLKGDCELAKNLLDVPDNLKVEETDCDRVSYVFNEEKNLNFHTDFKEALFEKLKLSIRNYVNNLKHQCGLDFPMMITKGYDAISILLELPDAQCQENSSIKTLILMSAVVMHEKLHTVTSTVYPIDGISFNNMIDYFDKLNRYKKSIKNAFSGDIVTRNSIMEQVEHLERTMCDLYTKNELERTLFVYNSEIKNKLHIYVSELKISDSIGSTIEKEIFHRFEEPFDTGVTFLILSALGAFYKILSMFISDLSDVIKQLVNLTFTSSDFVPNNVESLLLLLSKEAITISNYVQKKLLYLIDNYLIILNDSNDILKITEFKNKIANLALKIAQLSSNSSESACSVTLRRMSPIKENLFTAKWYETELMTLAVGIITDTLASVDFGNNDEFKLIIAHKIFKGIVDIYLDSLKAKKIVLKKGCDEIIRNDIKIIENTLRTLDVSDPESYTVTVRALAEIISASKQTALADACKAFYESYNGCTISLLRRILEESPNCNDDIIESILSKFDSSDEHNRLFVSS